MNKTPRHIAIVMDGNGRWAKKRFLPRIAGHRAGVNAVRRSVQLCLEQGVEYLTLFAFSSENWSRPASEVDELMSLFLTALEKEVAKLHENQIRLRIIGDISKFSPTLQTAIQKAENTTRNNQKLNLVIAANYGGKWDIVQAAGQISQLIKAGVYDANGITPEIFDQYLVTAGIPDPDLFIRTSGEQRISNFLLWQMAYTELYFVDDHWPDFSEEQFMKALDFYATRERRYGATSEQIRL